jgi:hypothetical protein
MNSGIYKIAPSGANAPLFFVFRGELNSFVICAALLRRAYTLLLLILFMRA